MTLIQYLVLCSLHTVQEVAAVGETFKQGVGNSASLDLLEVGALALVLV